MNELIAKQLDDLRRKIEAGQFIHEALTVTAWGGADVIISSHLTLEIERDERGGNAKGSGVIETDNNAAFRHAPSARRIPTPAFPTADYQADPREETSGTAETNGTAKLIATWFVAIAM